MSMADDEPDQIIVSILRALQADVAEIKKAVTRIDGRISAMDSHMAGFHTLLRMHNDQHDDARGRLEALEQKNADDLHISA